MRKMFYLQAKYTDFCVVEFWENNQCIKTIEVDTLKVVNDECIYKGYDATEVLINGTLAIMINDDFEELVNDMCK